MSRPPRLTPVSHGPLATGEIWLTYSVFVTGLPIAEANIVVGLGGDAYNGLIDIQTTGLANLIADWSFRAESAGRRNADQLIPNEYVVRDRRRERERELEIFYGPNGPRPHRR